MAVLAEPRIRELLIPFYPQISDDLIGQLSRYLDLLLRWNERTSLTAVRSAEEVVVRHFGESLFAARWVPEAATLLDLGSGAGFPGIPIALARPGLQVTLAESQNKKAAFLREASRHLAVRVEVWGRRIEQMDARRRFDVVTLRAVDRAETARRLATDRVASGGTLLQLRRVATDGGEVIQMPDDSGVIQLWKMDVPRGTP